MNKKVYRLTKDILSIIAMVFIGCTAIIFSVLYIDKFSSGFFADNKTLCVTVCVSIITTLIYLSIIFMREKKDFVYKLFFLLIIAVGVASCVLYFMKISGFFEKIKSIEDFRQYIASFGPLAVLMFILIQFLQVVILPIPGVITVGTGVLLFGPLKGAIFSCIGIITGSIVAFFIGRLLGYKTVCWLVGKDKLDNTLKKIKGKDKILLIFAFLFPFFPDDILCFVAGITTIKVPFFLTAVFITRCISVFASSYSMNNSIIPYNTWWGILLWGLFFCFTLLLMFFIYKKGDKIQKYFNKD